MNQCKKLLLELLDLVSVLDFGHDFVAVSVRIATNDIEDILQYQTAIENKLDAFISGDTLIKKLSQKQLPVMTVDELIASFQ